MIHIANTHVRIEIEPSYDSLQGDEIDVLDFLDVYNSHTGASPFSFSGGYTLCRLFDKTG